MTEEATSVDVVEATIAVLQDHMSSGRLTARRLTEIYLDRIHRYNEEGPQLRAYREINDKALDTAIALDQERRDDGPRGPLHGIPLVIKDNMGTGDGMRTTVGVHALRDFRTPFDAHLVKTLRDAGAVILGKASCPDFCDYMSSTMPSEHSTTGGVIGHPYGLRYDRGGGSSTGVAAAVAANLAVAGIGSETQNSLQAPACNSSVVAIKPTVGLVSRSGLIPLAISQDTAGPVARTVVDAALLLSAIVGVDFEDGVTLTALGHVHRDYTRFCNAHALTGARIGVARGLFTSGPASEEHEELIEEALLAMHEAGADIVDPAEIPTAEIVGPLRSRVFKTDFKASLNEFLRRSGNSAPVRSMAEIVAHNEAWGQQATPYGQDLLKAAEATAGDWSEPEYHFDRARDVRLSRSEGIDRALRADNLDAIVVPMDRAAKLTGKAGYPAVSVPCGFTQAGAPVGVTFFGTCWSEPKLIALAYAFEQLGKARRPSALTP